MRAADGFLDCDTVHAAELVLFRWQRTEQDEAGQHGGDAPESFFLYQAAGHLLRVLAEESRHAFLRGETDDDPLGLAWDELVAGHLEEAARRATELLGSVAAGTRAEAPV